MTTKKLRKKCHCVAVTNKTEILLGKVFSRMVINLIAINFFKRQDHKVGSGTRDPNIFKKDPEPLILSDHI